MTSSFANILLSFHSIPSLHKITAFISNSWSYLWYKLFLLNGLCVKVNSYSLTSRLCFLWLILLDFNNFKSWRESLMNLGYDLSLRVMIWLFKRCWSFHTGEASGFGMSLPRPSTSSSSYFIIESNKLYSELVGSWSASGMAFSTSCII